MSAFSVENPHDGKMFENYTRFEWGVEVGVVTIFMLRLFVSREFDMFQPPFKFCMQLGTQGGIHKNALFKGRSTIVAMVTTAAYSGPGATFSYKNVAKKRVKCKYNITNGYHT